ncbi:MAG TPA: glycosyl hydrolase [Spirochaetota bacterium]|nr:glycosyl hydrolase [Spirochaetota bacterium]
MRPNIEQFFGFEWQPAICYSGYRRGQSPREERYPSIAQIREDLDLMQPYWHFLRLYDCSKHAKLVLQAIEEGNYDFKVLLGVDLAAEVSNPDCPWGADYTDKDLARQRKANEAQVHAAIKLANAYPDIIFAVSGGNEATVDWTDGLVPVERVAGYLKQLRAGISQPLTLCDNYVPWQQKIVPLAELVDFISIHTYPLWESIQPDAALAWSIENYESVASLYPDKPVIITEAGWTSRANGRGFQPELASEKAQQQYLRELMQWGEQKDILIFFFEAFDEPWKGSDDPLEPEKHWGLFYEDRTPKPAFTVLKELQAAACK